MAELADAPDLGSGEYFMWVQVPLPVPRKHTSEIVQLTYIADLNFASEML